jgi:hypothetical protein
MNSLVTKIDADYEGAYTRELSFDWCVFKTDSQY